MALYHPTKAGFLRPQKRAPFLTSGRVRPPKTTKLQMGNSSKGEHGNAPVTYTSSIAASIPEPEATPTHQPVVQKKAPAKFALGGSCSSSQQAMSVELPRSNLVVPPKKEMFHTGDPSSSSPGMNTESTKSLPEKRRQAVMPTGSIPELLNKTAIASDTGDYVDEDAIADDDSSSEWDDLIEESGNSSAEEKYFQRDESKLRLVSGQSLITLMVAQNERQKALSNQASHSASAIMRSSAGPSVGPVMGASPNDSDEGQLMMKGMRPSNLKPIVEVPRSVAQAIPAAPNYVHAPAALSPHTTRRNMLATKLSESLRRHLLWERQQKTSTANAVLKCRHTSHDGANLIVLPAADHFNKDAVDGYHLNECQKETPTVLKRRHTSPYNTNELNQDLYTLVNRYNCHAVGW